MQRTRDAEVRTRNGCAFFFTPWAHILERKRESGGISELKFTAWSGVMQTLL